MTLPPDVPGACWHNDTEALPTADWVLVVGSYTPADPEPTVLSWLTGLVVGVTDLLAGFPPSVSPTPGKFVLAVAGTTWRAWHATLTGGDTPAAVSVTDALTGATWTIEPPTEPYPTSYTVTPVPGTYGTAPTEPAATLAPLVEHRFGRTDVLADRLALPIPDLTALIGVDLTNT